MPKGKKEQTARYQKETPAELGPRVVVRANHHRGEMLMLHWREPSGAKSASLGKRMQYDRKGNPDPALDTWAYQRATQKALELAGQMPASTDEATPATPKAPFAIGDTWAAITDTDTGKYPHDSEFRREVKRALDYAEDVWGKDTAWIAIDDAQWTTLIRRRVKALLAQERQGIRGTEVTVSRLITVARWLRKTKRIPTEAAHAPEDWKDDLVQFWKGETGSKKDPAVHRPRHTPEEIATIVAKAHEVDPRFGLLCELAVEYRLGQAVRSWRSDLDLDKGTFEIHGSATKHGEIVLLTDGQITAAKAALAGILAPLEAQYQAGTLTDYPLFPGGYIQTVDTHGKPRVRLGRLWEPLRPASQEWVIANWHAAEDRAEVTKVKGRAAYGGRRARLDATLAEKPSDSGLQASGGWKSTKIPLEIYREEQNMIGRKEAQAIRAKVRGEVTDAPES